MVTIYSVLTIAAAQYKDISPRHLPVHPSCPSDQWDPTNEHIFMNRPFHYKTCPYTDNVNLWGQVSLSAKVVLTEYNYPSDTFTFTSHTK